MGPLGFAASPARPGGGVGGVATNISPGPEARGPEIRGGEAPAPLQLPDPGPGRSPWAGYDKSIAKPKNIRNVFVFLFS